MECLNEETANLENWEWTIDLILNVTFLEIIEYILISAK